MTEPIADAGASSQPAGETQNAEVNADAGKVAASDESQAQQTDSADKAAEAPESYEFKLPEGIEADKSALEEFTTFAKELKLKGEDAQKAVDIGMRMVERQQEAHRKLVESWAEEVKGDKELGGDKLNQNLAVAKKAVDAFGGPELKAMLDQTGLGNHPAVIKMFVAVGKKISEDSLVQGDRSGAGAPKSIAERLYPSN